MQIYWIIISVAFLALLLGIGSYYAFGFWGMTIALIACVILAIWQIKRALIAQIKAENPSHDDSESN